MKQRALEYEKKLEIIEQLKTKAKHSDLAQKYGVSRTLITKLNSKRAQDEIQAKIDRIGPALLKMRRDKLQRFICLEEELVVGFVRNEKNNMS